MNKINFWSVLLCIFTEQQISRVHQSIRYFVLLSVSRCIGMGMTCLLSVGQKETMHMERFPRFDWGALWCHLWWGVFFFLENEGREKENAWSQVRTAAMESRHWSVAPDTGSNVTCLEKKTGFKVAQNSFLFFLEPFRSRCDFLSLELYRFKCPCYLFKVTLHCSFHCV